MKEYTISEINKQDEDSMEYLRALRSQECFNIVNRGKLWYDKLSLDQVSELEIWYTDWLNVTKNDPIVVPITPGWLI